MNETYHVACPDCGAAMHLVVWPRPGGLPSASYRCVKWPACSGSHGAHPDGRPMGVPGDAATRAERGRGHRLLQEFQRVYESQTYAAYRFLADAMGLTSDGAHFAKFDYAQCLEACGVLRAAIRDAGPDEFALLQACRAAPTDTLPKLVYADWLDEHDRSDRARVIRDHVAGAALEFKLFPGGSAYRASAAHRACKTPLFRHRKQVGSGRYTLHTPSSYAVRGCVFTWIGGFLTEVRCPTDFWVRRGPALVRMREACVGAVTFSDWEVHAPVVWAPHESEDARQAVFDRLSAVGMADRELDGGPVYEYGDGWTRTVGWRYADVTTTYRALSAAALDHAWRGCLESLS